MGLPAKAVAVVVVVLSIVTLGHTTQEETEDARADVAPSSNPFSVLSLLKTPSNLANLLSNAMTREEVEVEEEEEEEYKGRLEEEEEEEGSSNTTRIETFENITVSTSPVSLVAFLSKLSSSLASSSSSSSTPAGDDVKFSPASSTQFGDPGTGSKLVDLFTDITDYSVSATEVAPFAGAGAVALLALGALFAAPIAPALLRRTGAAGWAGLPSLNDLFGWFRTEDPVAEAWADSQYQGYEPGAGQYGGGGGGYMRREHYGSQPEQYYEGTHENPHRQAPPPNPHQAPANPQHPYYETPPTRYPHNPKRRQGNRRVGNDGYEYVNLDDINRIGDASVRLFAQIVQDMGENDNPQYFPDGGDNEVRRRLSMPQRPRAPYGHSPSPQNPYGPSQSPQNPYGPSQNPQYQYENPQDTNQYENQKINYQYQYPEFQGPSNTQNTEGYTLEELQWYTDDEGKVTGQHSLVEHPYKDDVVPHPYKDESDVFKSEKLTGKIDSSVSQSSQAVKVSDFPYEFHKSD